MKTKNHFEIRGFVGADPEVKTLDGGKKVVNLRIATNEILSSKKSEEKKTLTHWHSVILWNGTAEFAGKYVKKGALVSIEGRIVPRSYEKDGQTRYTVDLVADSLDIILNKEKE